ncbi:hypothetical protein SAMN05518855_101164 [Paenibacillus sp. CF384]|nr:hypothetical protein SAMN05518855_101164 [Paenibacillus sp. CF384]
MLHFKQYLLDALNIYTLPSNLLAPPHSQVTASHHFKLAHGLHPP